MTFAPTELQKYRIGKLSRNSSKTFLPKKKKKKIGVVLMTAAAMTLQI
jgi:hypothetical protein